MQGRIHHTPVRMCATCRRRAPKDQLVRIAVTAGRIGPDLPARTPGRGAYVCRARTCLDRALRGQAAPLRRALRTAATDVDDTALTAAVDGAAHNHGTAVNRTAAHDRHSAHDSHIQDRQSSTTNNDDDSAVRGATE